MVQSISRRGGARGVLEQVGCQPGVMVLTDLYGESTLSGASQETLMDGGHTHCGASLLPLTSPLGGACGELTPLKVGCA